MRSPDPWPSIFLFQPSTSKTRENPELIIIIIEEEKQKEPLFHVIGNFGHFPFTEITM